MSNILEARGLTKNYGGFNALNNVNLNLEKGRIVGLLGPNGSGKTTFIKLLTGLLQPTDGEVRINGHLPGIESEKIVSYLPDAMYLNSWMSVQQLVDYYGDFFEDFDKNRAYQMLESLNINPKLRLKTLSKGTKEKVQLILTMSRHAKLYVLDEPIAGVDPAARDYILRTILNNYDEDATVLISTHLISDIENILDDVVFLKQGNVVLTSEVEELRLRHQKSVDSLFREVFVCF